MATLDTVRDLLVSNLDVDPEAVTEDATLDSLDIDSLDMVELVCDLEEECGVELGELEDVKTIGELVAHIDSLRG